MSAKSTFSSTPSYASSSKMDRKELAAEEAVVYEGR
jgi:hypothetical protein